MRIQNTKAINFIMLLFGMIILFYTSSIAYKMIIYLQKGEVKTAKIIGYKISSNGVRMVQSNKTIAGRSPFFEFSTSDNQTIKQYSNLPQIFFLFNYDLNEKVTVAYPKNEPEKAIILSWKEIPGLLLLIGFGILSVFIGKDLFLK